MCVGLQARSYITHDRQTESQRNGVLGPWGYANHPPSFLLIKAGVRTPRYHGEDLSDAVTSNVCRGSRQEAEEGFRKGG